MFIKKCLRAAVFATLLFSGMASAVITITFPANNDMRVPAGPDYATDVLGDPWDMSNPEDVSINPDDRNGWAPGSFGFPGNGTVGGTTALTSTGGIDTAVFFLSQGLYGIVNPGRTGGRFPIDSSVYKKIAFKMFSGAAGQLPAVYWFHTSPGDPASTPAGVKFTPNVTVQGSSFFVTDLTVQAEQGSPPWSSAPVVGLRIDPNATAVGHNVFFDWVRVTRADSDPLAAHVSIEWTGTTPGSATIEVADSAGIVLTVATNATTPFNWNYGVLPPGTYTITVKSGAQSSQAVTIRINDPPQVRVTDPNETGGEDFATTVLGNAWDMNGPEDVAVLSNVTNVSFDVGVLNATNTNGDPGIVLFDSSTSTIDTSRYRYLTYRLKVDGAFDLSPQGGSVARVFWSSTFNPTGSLVTLTKDIIVWPGVVPNTPGFVTYTVDLGALTTANGGLEQFGTQQPWSAANIRYFRIDPHEFGAARSFHLDYVRLAAMREARGSFTITYSASDANPEDTGATVNLYFAPDKTGPGQPIASSLPLSLAGQYVWDISNVSPGAYYIYAEVSDGFDVRGSYSTGQLLVLAPAAPAPPGPPTINSITMGAGTATIGFTAPSDTGGSAITSFTATCTAPGQTTRSNTGLGSPITVSGLTGGVTYSCSVTASNSIGTSPSSAPLPVTTQRGRNIVPVLMMLLFN